jgi:hypothetical protein
VCAAAAKKKKVCLLPCRFLHGQSISSCLLPREAAQHMTIIIAMALLGSLVLVLLGSGLPLQGDLEDLVFFEVLLGTNIKLTHTMLGTKHAQYVGVINL